MHPPLTLAVRVRRAHEQLASTPGQLWLVLAAVWLLDVGFFLAVRAGVDQHRQAVQTVGKDAVPSIIAAQKIKANLAAMHTCAANVLLYGPGEGKQPAAEHDQRRKKAMEDILDAAGNITYGEEEKGPLRQLLYALGDYEESSAQARILHERGEAGPALRKHRLADQVMQETILPAADALDQVNSAALDRAYARIQTNSVLALGGVVLPGLVLLAVLLMAQWFLYRRMRRVVNPGLAAATLLTAAFLAYSGWVLRPGRRAEDGKGRRLPQHARPVAGAGGSPRRQRRQESLAAGPCAGGAGTRRASSTRQPGSPGCPRTCRRRNCLPRRRTASRRRASRATSRELANITFPGEREAAVGSVKAFLDYLHIDRTIRELERKGGHAEAVRLCLGKSNVQFDSFDDALGSTIAINQKEYDRAVAGSFRNLDRMAFAVPLTALAAALLTLLGLLPRLREYAAHLRGHPEPLPPTPSPKRRGGAGTTQPDPRQAPLDFFSPSPLRGGGWGRGSGLPVTDPE